LIICRKGGDEPHRLRRGSSRLRPLSSESSPERRSAGPRQTTIPHRGGSTAGAVVRYTLQWALRAGLVNGQRTERRIFRPGEDGPACALSSVRASFDKYELSAPDGARKRTAPWHRLPGGVDCDPSRRPRRDGRVRCSHKRDERILTKLCLLFRDRVVERPVRTGPGSFSEYERSSTGVVVESAEAITCGLRSGGRFPSIARS